MPFLRLTEGDREVYYYHQYDKWDGDKWYQNQVPVETIHAIRLLEFQLNGPVYVNKEVDVEITDWKSDDTFISPNETYEFRVTLYDADESDPEEKMPISINFEIGVDEQGIYLKADKPIDATILAHIDIYTNNHPLVKMNMVPNQLPYTD